MKVLRIICIIALIVECLGMLLLWIQPIGCSPFIAIGFVVSGLVIAICAWIFWHFVKYE